MQQLLPSPQVAARSRRSLRSSLNPLHPLQLVLHLQLRLPLLQEEIAATADVDAIVDQQLWHIRTHEQRLTRLPWQPLNLALLQCLFRHALRRHHL